MLGLQRGTVRLVPHDDTWPQEAACTIRQQILGATAVDIQHSTAIPLTKPILDLAIFSPRCRRWRGRGFFSAARWCRGNGCL